MNSDAQQAHNALQAISRAQRVARQHGPNNGMVPLVWGGVVLVCLIGYDVLPWYWAAGINFAAAAVAGVWTWSYQRHLPVKPLKVEQPWLFGVWSFYHPLVLMGGAAVGTHGWQLHHALPGTGTVIGLLDSAPLLWVGWQQRRRTLGGHK